LPVRGKYPVSIDPRQGLEHCDEFSRIFLREEGGLRGEVKPRMVGALMEMLMNPYVGISLFDSPKGLWRVRVGKHRIVCEIKGKEKIGKAG